MCQAEPPPVDQLVFEFLERVEDTRAAPSSVLAELCAAWPLRAEPLRQAVARLAGNGLLADGEPEEEETIGPYRLGRRLGSGGMGIVYLAWRHGEERPVALKVLRADQLGEPGARERFEREVRAAASLDHPCIVRVLEHGVHRHGSGSTAVSEQPWVALEYHRGGTLDRAVQAHTTDDVPHLSGADLLRALDVEVDPLALPRPLAGPWWEVVCRVVREVARALAHAHARGIVHRDVKPSNVLVTPTGRVLLLDFGLASLRGASRLTLSGARLGSLPYMSPEQLAGDPGSDERTDVYSLGVTAYELLVMRLPFRGTSPESMALAISEGRTTPVSRVAPALAPEVARDLEAVLACAMHPEPKRRYASAEAFAADLTALLHRRSVVARPATALQRVATWTRRRPYAATSALLLAVLAVGGPAAFAVLSSLYSRRVEQSLDATLGHLAQLIDAVDGGLREVADGPLDESPRWLDTRLASLDKALAILDAARRDARPILAEDDPRSEVLTTRLEASRARLLRSRADTLYDLGREAEALLEYRAQEQTVRARAAADPGDGPALHDLGSCLAQQARALHRLARFDESLPLVQESVTLFERCRQGDSAPRIASGLAAVRILVAYSQAALGRPEEQVRELRQAEQLLSSVLDGGDRAWRHHARRGEARLRLGCGLAADPFAAERLLLEARADLQTALAEVPAHLDVRSLSVETELALALVRARLGRVDGARECVAAASAACERLLAERPHQPRIDAMLLRCREVDGYLAVRGGDLLGGLATMRRALDEQRQRRATEPSDDTARHDLISSLARLANQLVLTEALGPDGLIEADRLASEALALAAEDEGAPLAPARTWDRFTARYTRVVARLKSGQLAAAVEEDLEALTRAASAGGPLELRFLADAHNEHFLALVRDGALESSLASSLDGAREAALSTLERAIAAGYRDVEELATTPALDTFRQEPRFQRMLEALR